MMIHIIIILIITIMMIIIIIIRIVIITSIIIIIITTITIILIIITILMILLLLLLLLLLHIIIILILLIIIMIQGKQRLLGARGRRASGKRAVRWLGASREEVKKELEYRTPRLHSPENSPRFPEIAGDVCKSKTSFL